MVSLFSHKKYDTLGREYRDSRDGFHAVIFRLAKGQGEALKNDLTAHGVTNTAQQCPFSLCPFTHAAG